MIAARLKDVVLRDPALSRHHAELSPHDGGWVLNDNGSRNGSFVDGKPVNQPTHLRPGSRISVGSCTLVFSVDAPFFRPLKTEMMFAWMVVVLIPLAVVLFLVQAVLWCTVPASRPLKRRP